MAFDSPSSKMNKLVIENDRIIRVAWLNRGSVRNYSYNWKRTECWAVSILESIPNQSAPSLVEWMKHLLVQSYQATSSSNIYWCSYQFEIIHVHSLVCGLFGEKSGDIFQQLDKNDLRKVVSLNIPEIIEIKNCSHTRKPSSRVVPQRSSNSLQLSNQLIRHKSVLKRESLTLRSFWEASDSSSGKQIASICKVLETTWGFYEQHVTPCWTKTEFIVKEKLQKYANLHVPDKSRSSLSGRILRVKDRKKIHWVNFFYSLRSQLIELKSNQQNTCYHHLILTHLDENKSQQTHNDPKQNAVIAPTISHDRSYAKQAN